MTLVHILFALCFSTFVYCRTTNNGSGSTLVVPEMCSHGPEVWCQNLTTAAQCNAVKHCVQTVWSKANLLQSDSCSTCVTQIDDIRNGVNSNTTKDVIKEALDYICELTIFTRILRKECEDFINIYVDENINELLDLLKSDIDSKTICHIFGFCTTSMATVEDEVVLQFQNIVLHFPAHDIQIIDVFQSKDVQVTEEPKLVGAEKCTWGPSYWCDTISTSKECNAAAHCVEKVWSTKVYPEDTDSVCQVCKDMVKQARDQLLSNETQEELKEVFEGSCKLIPIKEVRKECIVLADDFVPELTEMLASQMNPTAVCTVAGLCNSRRIDNLLAAESKAVNNFSAVDSCLNCTVAFTSFNRFVRKTPKNDLLLRVLAVCDELSSYSDLCSSLVVTNFDDLYETMTYELQPFAACHLSGMCSQQYHSHSSSEDSEDFARKVQTMLAVQDDDLPCDLCKQLVTHLKDILVANTTETEFLQVLHGICQQTDKYEDECLHIVNDNFRVFYKFLTDELDPAQLCKDINICPGAARTLLTDHKVDIISSSGRLVPVLAAPVNLTNLSPLTQTAKIADVECRLCKLVVGEIERELKNPEYEHDIETVLKKVCALVPSSDRDGCQNFIDEYTDVLIKTLTDGTDPHAFCALLHVCSQMYAPPKRANELCPLCQSVLHLLQNALQDPKDQHQIEQAVKKVCVLVPQSEKNTCDQFIAEYSSLLITILAQEVDPSVVCPAIKVCPSLQSPQERCAHCRLLTSNLIAQLDGNYLVNNVKDKIAGLVLPKGDEKTAVAVELTVSQSEDLVDVMTAEFDVDESCVYLQFCDVRSVSALAKQDELETNDIPGQLSAGVEGKPSCAICEAFVTMYEKELTSNQTVAELEAMFRKLCAKFENTDFKEKCVKSVDKYVPVILDLLKKDVTPKELCAAAKFCSLRSLTDKMQSECRACELAVGGLESVLGDPTYKQDAVEKALQVCHYMTGKSSEICSQLVEELVPQLAGIAFDVPAWFVCTKLKMCPYTDRMDASVCSNPESWCQDVKSAFMCDRLSFCQKTAW